MLLSNLIDQVLALHVIRPYGIVPLAPRSTAAAVLLFFSAARAQNTSKGDRTKNQTKLYRNLCAFFT